MHRDSNEIKNLNQLYSLLHKRDNSVQFQVNTSTMGKLNSKAPLPPSTIAALLQLLKRHSHTLDMFYPSCFAKRCGDHGYHQLVQHGLHERLERDPAFLNVKPREAVYSLLLVEKAEFAFVVSEQEFLNGQPTFYYGGHPNYHTQHWTRPGSHFSSAALPAELQPLPSAYQPLSMPVPVPMPTATHPPPAPPSMHQPPPIPSHQLGRDSTRGGRRNNQYHNTRPPPQAGNSGGERPNNRFHPLFRNYWNNAPPACQNIGVALVLRGANATTAQAINILGLGNNDCGLFHIKGCCSRRGCNLLHTERDLPTPQVQQVVNLLQTGQQHVR